VKSESEVQKQLLCSAGKLMSMYIAGKTTLRISMRNGGGMRSTYIVPSNLFLF